MRATFLELGLVVLLVSCGPSAQQLRVQHVAQTRTDAQQRPGARQALAYAEAVHDSYKAGDFKATPQQLGPELGEAIRILDLATPNSGIDAPTLVAWRAQMLLDGGRLDDARAEYLRSWQLGPNRRAGLILIGYYGSRNDQQQVSYYCNGTIGLMTTDDDKLELIQVCRENMNAATPEGEMAWMSPELVRWYQSENARRLEAQIAYQNQQAQREQEENRVVRRNEQCNYSCKERGLRCQNNCGGDAVCDDRCVQINHACVDRCYAAAQEALGQ